MLFSRRAEDRGYRLKYTPTTMDFVEQLNADSWYVAQVRFTAFFAGKDEPHPADWTGLVGREPEDSVTRRRAEGVVLGEAGIVDGLRWSTNRAPGRTDVFVARPQEDIPSTGPTFGTLREVEQHAFVRIGDFIGSLSPSPTRIALGAIFYARAMNVTAAHGLLGRLLGLSSHLEGAADFIYQINYPSTSSSIEDVELNFLSRWSVENQAAVRQAPDGLLSINRSDLIHVCKLTLDFSSSPEADLSSRTDLRRVWGEFWQAASATLSRGPKR